MPSLVLEEGRGARRFTHDPASAHGADTIGGRKRPEKQRAHDPRHFATLKEVTETTLPIPARSMRTPSGW
ncbi:MAG: hypothetical protein U1A23_01130 [Candidatus Sungbacteria bacterium]|nr:hypothetical protein [bacterium]MDZ4285512.1 hypothetical protein [Candidatus Sungbacteria bacterium]